MHLIDVLLDVRKLPAAPTGFTVGRAAMAQDLSRELKNMTTFLSDINKVVSTGNPVPANYVYHGLSCYIFKGEGMLWEVETTGFLPEVPQIMTSKQIASIGNKYDALKLATIELLANPYLIDYVGKDEQFDWASILFVTTKAVELMKHLVNNQVEVCAA